MKISAFNQYKTVGPSDYRTISFGAMKKSQFNNMDLNIIEKFKAPIEKFNTVQDLYNWAEGEYRKLSQKTFTGNTSKINEKRATDFQKWVQILDNSKYSAAQKLYILSDLTKDLKDNNSTLLPAADSKILQSTIEEIEERVEKKPKVQINFKKLYFDKLREKVLENTKENKTWIVIPSLLHDSENFTTNIERLKLLSAKSWCTGTFKSEQYLTEGDMHNLYG